MFIRYVTNTFQSQKHVAPIEVYSENFIIVFLPTCILFYSRIKL